MIGQPLVSIIIPCKDIDEYSKECIDRCKQLSYERYEIILLPDEATEAMEGVKVIPTGPVTPGTKRNIGIANSIGDICAFIDSDAYPSGNWLSNAVKYFEDPEVAAVGGPGLTPEEDSFMQKVGGFVLSSFMVGALSKRYKSGKVYDSDDIHSCNFIARKSILKTIGGWDEKYWPGEDTLISGAIKRAGEKMVEAPDVVVYHHRRPLFRKHLKQISSYGFHRGFFVKKFKDNSLRPLYFVPSLLTSFILAGSILSLVSYSVFMLFLASLSVYVTLCLIASFIEVKDLKIILVVWLGIVLTHLFYGISFMIGLMKSDVKR